MQTVLLVTILALCGFISWELITKRKLSRELDNLQGRFDLLDLSSKTGTFLSPIDFIISNRNSLQSVLDRMTQAIFIKDDQNRLILVNTAFAKAYGIPRDKILGKTINEIGGSESVFKKFQASSKQKGKAEAQVYMPAYIITRPDGSKFAMNISTFPIAGAGSEVEVSLGISSTLRHDQIDTVPRFTSLIDNLGGVVYRCKSDENWTMEYISKEFKQLTGYDTEDVIGNRKLSFKDVIYPDDLEMIYNITYRAITQNKPYELEYRIVRKDGEIRWVLEHGLCVMKLGPNDSILEGYIADITESKNAANDLRVSHERLKVALEGAGCGLWDWDITQGKLFLSDECKLLLAIQNHVDIQDADYWLERVHPEQKDDILKNVRYCIDGGPDVLSLNVQIQDEKKQWRWVVLKGRVLKRDSSRQACRIVGTAIDITDQKLVENSIAKQLEVLKNPDATIQDFEFSELLDLKSLQDTQDTILEAFNISSVITDTNGNPIVSSPSTNEICSNFLKSSCDGIDRCTITNAIVSGITHNGPIIHRCKTIGFLEAGVAIKIGDRHLGNWLLGQVIDESFDRDKALKFVRENGLDAAAFEKELSKVARMTYKEFESISNIVYLFARQLSQLALQNFEQAVDILARIRSERELEAKNSEMERIIHISSHDLRSPLVNIQGFSLELKHSINEIKSIFEKEDLTEQDKMRLQILTGEEIPESIEFITSSAHKMDLLQKGLLQISRLGRRDLEMRPVKMNELLSEILSSMEYQLRSKVADVQISALPDCIGDMPTLNQVFTNLIDNALKYADPSKQCKIEITGKKEDGRVVYCVHDNGIGISQNNLQKVFELFYRIAPERQEIGEGLGLCLVKRIVQRHHGNVWAESCEGRYTKIFIELTSLQ